MSEETRRWEALKAWRDKRIARLKAEKELGKSTEIGRGGLMMCLALQDEMEKLEGKTAAPAKPPPPPANSLASGPKRDPAGS